MCGSPAKCGFTYSAWMINLDPIHYVSTTHRRQSSGGRRRKIYAEKHTSWYRLTYSTNIGKRYQLQRRLSRHVNKVGGPAIYRLSSKLWYDSYFFSFSFCQLKFISASFHTIEFIGIPDSMVVDTMDSNGILCYFIGFDWLGMYCFSLYSISLIRLGFVKVRIYLFREISMCDVLDWGRMWGTESVTSPMTFELWWAWVRLGW